MHITATPTTPDAIQPLRVLFLHEGNFQFVCNSYHARNWSTDYLLQADGVTVGYASLMGGDDRNMPDSVFEFYLLPPYRNMATLFFTELLAVAKPRFIYCQTNDALLASMLYEFAHNINAEAILFEDGFVSSLSCPQAVFRKKQATDILFEHKAEPKGNYVIELNGEVVATGGFLLHYNIPYADLYMEVREDQRHKGFGSFLIQEIKRECYLFGRVPAARTGTDNKASKATLMKAGFKVCGERVKGEIR